ncbi:30S ribosomal protein S8 [Nanoarchaeota archaeon]
MAINDPLSNALSKILNSERVSKKQVIIKPTSKIIKQVLDIMNEEGYIGKYEEVVDGKGNYLKLELLGKVNKCCAIKPRFAVSLDGYEKYEKRFLLAKNFGVLIVTTNKGLMTQQKAREKKLGGKLVAYCY